MFWIGLAAGFIVGLACGCAVILCSDMQETIDDITHKNDWIR